MAGVASRRSTGHNPPQLSSSRRCRVWRNVNARVQLADKRAARYSATDEEAVRDWIAGTTGAPFPPGPFADALKSGVLLCKFMNAISPGKIKKINESTLPFKMMVRGPTGGEECVPSAFTKAHPRWPD